MCVTKFFQLALVTGLFFLNACYQGKLSEGNSSIAPNADELEVWNDSEVDALEAQPSIWDITTRHGSFSTLAQLSEAAGLQETLKSDLRLTLLAPTDEAFAQLPEGSIDLLLKEENKPLLIELLLNHVISEVFLSVDLLDGETTATLSGNKLVISKDEKIKLSNATVTTADISASNGVVHVVDQVILGE